jgi:hypothetical protein
MVMILSACRATGGANANANGVHAVALIHSGSFARWALEIAFKWLSRLLMFEPTTGPFKCFVLLCAGSLIRPLLALAQYHLASCKQ